MLRDDRAEFGPGRRISKRIGGATADELLTSHKLDEHLPDFKDFCINLA